MKTLFKILLFLGLTQINAQNQRLIYEAKFVTDSAQRANPEVEMMYLDITPKKSVFYSYNRFKQDSLIQHK